MAVELETYRGVVYPWHCDHVGHMNVMWYAGKFDEATWGFFAHLGMTAAFLRDNHRGMVAVDQHISYKQELRAGDTVYITSRPIDFADRKIRFAHDMYNSATGDLAATTEYWGVHLDTQTRRSTQLPDFVVTKLKSILELQTQP